MRHGKLVLRRLGRSVRLRLGLLMCAIVALPALFADLLAADGPLWVVGGSGFRPFAAVVDAERYGQASPESIAAEHADDFAIWPLRRFGPERVTAAGPRAAPSAEHWLGTDGEGRDVMARLVHGIRRTLGVTLLALLAALCLGVPVGALAGHSGGFWDELLSRPVELIQAFPALVAIAVARAVDPSGSPWVFGAAVAAVRWAEVARLVRGEVVRLGSEDFVLGARAIGCSAWRTFWRHVLPQALRPVGVSVMFGAVSLVLLEVAASFIGIGVDASWGALIADGLHGGGTLLSVLAGVGALAVFATGAYLVADAADEACDARLASRRRLVDRRVRSFVWRLLSSRDG
ncbi:MAG: ABC transporter permease [Polyangiaceae bacterium]|nr:ABC transporter permease [Polyangiaceae bacterium]